ncbi:protein NLRC3 [Pimephales promelas]|nr:protein NLRC3 [Pimephales promelas]
MYIKMCLCVYSVVHGGEFRMTAGLRKCMSAYERTHTVLSDCCVFDVSLILCSDACDLRLDPNTAHSRLILSDENRKATYVYGHQPYPDHPERFKNCEQVLCGERLTGRCYWEAEWSGYNADISVSYKGVNWKGGSVLGFGSNANSWSLICSERKFSAWHIKKRTFIPAPSPFSYRVGVYVDVSAGTLSFYSVSDTHTLTHLHTFNTTFTEPLYAGFRVYLNSSVSLCPIKT